MSNSKKIYNVGVWVLILCTVACGSIRHLPAEKEEPKLTVDDLFILGQKMKLERHPEKAIRYFKAFQQLKPENATVYYEIARQYNHLDKADSILKYAKKAAELAPSNKWILQFYARTLANRKDFKEAANIFHHLAEKQQHTEEFVFQEALMLYLSKDYERALSLFDSLEEKNGANEELTFQKQRIYVKLNQISAASEEIQKLITKYPDNSRYYALLAQLYAKHDQPEEAIDVYLNLLDKQPNNFQAPLALAILYKQTGQTQKFKHYIKEAFHNPDFGIKKKIHFIFPFLKYVEIDSSQRPDALWLSHLLTQVHPDDARSYALLGDMYFKCEEQDSALYYYKEASSYKDARQEVWNQIMFLSARKKRPDSLMAYSMEALKRYPKDARALFFYGTALSLKNLNKKAASELQRALEMQIESSELKRNIYQALSHVYFKLNKKRKAAKYRKTADQLKQKQKKKKQPDKT